jgi:hypothetical protein
MPAAIFIVAAMVIKVRCSKFASVPPESLL